MSFLQLDDYFLTRLHVDFAMPDDGKAEIENVAIDFDYDVLVNREDPLLFFLVLRIFVAEETEDEERVGHRIDCEINGNFRMPEEIPEEQREAMRRINGVSILYSTLRGIVGGVTGSFPDGLFCLPTIMPQDVVRRVEERKERERAATKKATAKRATKKTPAKRKRAAKKSTKS